MIRHSWLVALLVLGTGRNALPACLLRTYAIGVEKGRVLAPEWLETTEAWAEDSLPSGNFMKKYMPSCRGTLLFNQNPLSRH